MSYLVSPCCGAEYNSDEIPISTCCGAKKQEDSDLCADFDCLEHADFLEYQCVNCSDWFEEPEEDYEYEERMRESIAEDRADERRDMGE